MPSPQVLARFPQGVLPCPWLQARAPRKSSGRSSSGCAGAGDRPARLCWGSRGLRPKRKALLLGVSSRHSTRSVSRKRTRKYFPKITLNCHNALSLQSPRRSNTRNKGPEERVREPRAQGPRRGRTHSISVTLGLGVRGPACEAAVRAAARSPAARFGLAASPLVCGVGTRPDGAARWARVGDPWAALTGGRTMSSEARAGTARLSGPLVKQTVAPPPRPPAKGTRRPGQQRGTDLRQQE